jgi:RNA polymerase sigma-70 factor, ECF subfamily
VKYTDSDDLTLVRAFREGDEKAFEEIVRRYQRQVANVVYLTMGSRSEVEDLTQEVFVRVYRSIDRVTIESSLFSWIYRITMNLCIDELRRRRIKRMLSMDPTATSSGEHVEVFQEPARASDALFAEEKQTKVLEAIAKLTPAHRAALVLREYEDMSYRDIAASLGITEQAVKSRIFRAREELKELLKDYFKERL